METIFCKGCRCHRVITDYDVVKGVIRKTCNTCKKKRFCEHGQYKQYCKDCGGSQFCEHNRLKTECKECGDDINITIIMMIQSSKKSDKKSNRYDQTNFIDYCFVKNIIDDCEDKCCYCKCDLQYISYQGDLATIERINDDIGHIKGNCKIACRTCNTKKIKD